MPRFAANLTMLYSELPFLERFEAAAKDGFEYVEFLFPYEWKADALQKQLQAHQLKQVLFNLPPGDWENGERGIACLPNRQEEFRQGVDVAIEYALTLGVCRINCLAGLQSAQYTYEQQWSTLVSNVRYAAQQLAKHQIELMIEPINSKVDMAGFFIDTLDKVLKLISDVGEANVKVQFDIYHMQIMHGDLIRSMTALGSSIGHIQFADNPGRHEPGTGELNFPMLFQALDDIHYKGYVSAEYKPKHSTQSSLQWLHQAKG